MRLLKSHHLAFTCAGVPRDHCAQPALPADHGGRSYYVDMDGNVGSAPAANAYRFDGQVNWRQPRASWQAVYQGMVQTG